MAWTERVKSQSIMFEDFECDDGVQMVPIAFRSTPHLARTSQPYSEQEEEPFVDAGIILLRDEQSVDESLTAKNKAIILSLALANFGSTAAFSILAPFFPAVAADRGATKTQVGVIFGAYNLFMLVFSPLYGKYLVQIGPKFLLVIGLLTCGSTTALFGIMEQSPKNATFVSLCLILRMFQAVGSAAYVTASLSIIALQFPTRVSSIVGMLEVFVGLGFCLGPPLGGALYEAGGFGLPFYVLGGVLVIIALFTFIVVPTQTKVTTDTKLSYLTYLQSASVWFTLPIIFGAVLAFSFLEPTLEPFLKQFNLTSLEVGLMFLCLAGPYTLGAPIVGLLIDSKLKMYQQHLLLGGICILVIGYTFIGPAPFLGLRPMLWLTALSLGFAGLGFGAIFIPSYQRIRGFPDNLDTFGLVSGIFQTTFSLGAFLGPLLGGVITEYIGFSWCATVMAGINVVMLLLAVADTLRQQME